MRARVCQGMSRILLAFLVVVLVRCGADVDATIDFYQGENWRAALEITIAADALAIAGGTAEIERGLDELIAQAEALNARASWKKTRADNNLVYSIGMNGQGLDALSDLVFDGDAEIVVDESTGRRVIHFSQYASSGLGFSSQTLTLRGGEIVSGNGRRVDNRTMTWPDWSGRVEATLTERSRVNLITVLGVAAGIGVLVGLVYGGSRLIARGRRPGPAACPWCGFWIPEGARYCPDCGRRR